MVFKLCSDVRETSITGGTGNQVLAGALDPSYNTFASRYSDTWQAFVCLKQGTSRELSLVTYNGTANSITRTQVYKSTNSNNLVNFTAGQAVDIFVTNIGPDDLDAAGRALVAASEGTVSTAAAQSLNATQQNLAQKNAGIPAIMRGYIAGLTLSTAGSSPVFWYCVWRGDR
jgi:hypothetical protein